MLLPDERYIDNGRIVLEAGVSAGIDMSLYRVERLPGSAQANETARHIPYDDYWQR